MALVARGIESWHSLTTTNIEFYSMAAKEL